MKPVRAVTLLELLIAIILFSTIAIGFYSIDSFSRNQVISSQNQAQVQNEASIALAHITKEVMRGIGSTVHLTDPTVEDRIPVKTDNVASDTALWVYVDVAADGVLAGDGKWGTAGADRWRVYRFRDAGAGIGDRYQLWYYPNYTDPSGPYEVIARNISAFSVATSQNYVSVTITACLDPSGSAYACGTMKNPQVTMSTKIKIPAVSLN